MGRSSLTRRIERLEGAIRELQSARLGRFAPYAQDPAGYARDVLGVTLIPEIAHTLTSLLEPPYRTSVDSGHGVGKTFGAAAAVNWWYDTRGVCWVITTAPTERDVKDLLWTEVRLQRQRAKLPLPNDLLPMAPEMRSGPEHVAKGYTARDANSAQGRHRPNMLFIFDEKEGVGGAFWDGAKSMFRPGSGDAWLVIGNPITTTSRAALEHKAADAEGNPTWTRVRINALDHPNIAAGLRGEPPPIPGAVTVGQVDQWVNDWCDPVAKGDERPTDIRWRGKVYRPGPIGEARILGLRPSAGTFGVWSEALWALVLGPEPEVPFSAEPEMGCDAAGYGTDYTAFHVRCGPVSLWHQAVNGWDHLRVAERIMAYCAEAAVWQTQRRGPGYAPTDPKAVLVKIDDDAIGRDVTTILQRQGYRVRPMNAASAPVRPDLYGKVRDELWFTAARRAALGLVNVSRLDRATRQRLELQALAPEWWPDAAGRRVVESKDELRKPDRMGRSPDDMDALNLAYAEGGAVEVPTGITAQSGPRKPGVDSASTRTRRNLYRR